MSVRAPASTAAASFSRTPPTGRTSPCAVISPVNAISGTGAFPLIALMSATASAMPAEGPSIGTPPGTLKLTSYSLQSSAKQRRKASRTFSAETRAVPLRRSLRVRRSISSSSTMPPKWSVPAPRSARTAVHSISIATPCPPPETASPAHTPTRGVSESRCVSLRLWWQVSATQSTSPAVISSRPSAWAAPPASCTMFTASRPEAQ